MEGGWFSKWGSRLGAADIRLKSLEQLYTDGGRIVLKIGSRFGAARTRVSLQIQLFSGYKNKMDCATKTYQISSITARAHFLINVRPIGRLSGQWGARLSRARVQV